ncbi:hypothetical protein [Edaphobacter flagellatus]|uniref:hypothetical protein n=1 Tax=Edaphobacter flagellatus TaxID=1933044 RepID=UPI0021B31726|nr:hypothetical protein [Edaphobacter flagellatus]
MTERDIQGQLSRRELLYLSAAGFLSTLSLPAAALAANTAQDADPHTDSNLYSTLLKTWCDGMLAHQVTAIKDPALHGALLCPACSIIHGRCGDALYPLLRVAHDTGDAKYLNAALLVYDWTERQVGREDGSWVNDVTLSSWKGITVFHTIALGEAIHHHGALLDATTRQQWTARLARAAKFLDGFISIQTGNINYPITASYCFALCGNVLGEQKYLDRARALAHESLHYFTPNGLIFGEGHPLEQRTAKGCFPVDLGYNVEESLPALALYSLQTGDKEVLDRVISSLKAHMEFMLPDGAWDNSWGTRNYKWTWWGSRTSDGCHPAYVLLSEHDPRFLEAAHRNLKLMHACTRDGLLYGGPDYFAHGDQPCIHHTFTHAKALATVLDRTKQAEPSGTVTLPRDTAYGVKTFPEIGTNLIAIGDWRATVTEYDWEYVEHVQAGAGATGGGHATGGALSLLYHQALGPILTTSMTQYQLIELSNQQVFSDAPHMTLTPRIECAGEQVFTSLSDNEASLTRTTTTDTIAFEARGRLLTASHQPMPNGARYRLVYHFTAAGVEIAATIESSAAHASSARLIVPVIANSNEPATITSNGSVQIRRKMGDIVATVGTGQSFQPLPKERTFNLVPGFECVPLEIVMKPQEEVRLRVEVHPRQTS